ncbi:hypothetical protein LGN13_24070 [Burkholderia multivorans]|uniref:Uncharacterized protein n=1 Tax=Burkholderia multivorans TaxID=87883 RepID=A0AAP2MQJ1_9BURK|nr:hypothetical protein [Burkholderia multivorans]MBU9185291.1 hypothetical protein [Burkholderia multivorans]MBU9358799.1 hypothetical protein [Burkholderia multivorans]MCA8504777.1 hypothetical protein [Burkholderia multivorans]MDN8083630.1 hypothetical protein [Burkholderia multivorans]
MTSVASVMGGGRVISPAPFLPAYAFRELGSSFDGPESYAQSLTERIAAATRRRVVPLSENITWGQLEPTLQFDFVFELGAPLVDAVWPQAEMKLSWLATVRQLCASGKEDAALKEISLAAARFKVSQEFDKLSSELSALELKGLPDIVLVALLRNTFSIRAQISTWDSLLCKVEALLRDRKRDPRFLLRGLKKYS